MLRRNATVSALDELLKVRADNRCRHDLAPQHDEQQQRRDRRAGRGPRGRSQCEPPFFFPASLWSTSSGTEFRTKK